jgi:5-methylcytosine-specific restriction endonuclease McrBC GTP-binding regulatory subunit McrB
MKKQKESIEHKVVISSPCDSFFLSFLKKNKFMFFFFFDIDNLYIFGTPNKITQNIRHYLFSFLRS